ncbi:MAG: HEAT repeat domain-containing protein [Promethearchaeota archaeon]
MTSILEKLAEAKRPNEKRELAEYISSHLNEFEEIVIKVFNSETNNDARPQKQQILDLIDYLPSKISVPVLEKAIVDADPKIRVKTLQVTYRTRMDCLTSQVSEILTDVNEEFEVRKWAVHILSSCDPESFGKPLRKLAKNPDEDIRIRKEAVYALTKVTDDETIGALCALLGDSQVELRRSGAWALSSISSTESINCLLAALEDTDDEVRDWAIRALRDMDDARALQGLADTLSRVETAEQVRMIRLMIERRSEIVLRAIAELLTSENLDVKRTAAWAMGVSPYPPAASSLRDLTNDPDQQTQDYAKMALVRMGEFDSSDLRL